MVLKVQGGFMNNKEWRQEVIITILGTILWSLIGFCILVGVFGCAGKDGSNGQQGIPGQPGSSCTVNQLVTGTTVITCPDGTSAVIEPIKCTAYKYKNEVKVKCPKAKN